MFLVFFYPRGSLGVSNATFGLFIVNIQGLVFALFYIGHVWYPKST